MTAADESPPCNWRDLPQDIATTIFPKLGAVEILANAQWVCTDWRSLCRHPLMWRSIDMRNAGDRPDGALVDMCREAVDRSHGGCVDINIEYFGTDELLKYTADRCNQIRRLRLVRCENITDEGLSEAATKLPLETVGQCCPLLKSLKLNSVRCPFVEGDGEALAIAKNMHGLRYLQLFGNIMTDEGLESILDGCPRLEYLDLRQCLNVDMRGDLEERCTERIKDLRRPDDPTDDYEFAAFHADESSDDDDYP
ncbi:hypothetical protein BT93_L2831 [Corymbia citriodora subsp. variegata]|uniref:F-box domain-containing protein n=1 Tax=Corymbia citriodora subsp. variegata TaxID=360336 RepID=A0A8T0CIH8_CORYI|nr:hypothetical protein BT93_L2831 [Corymbia citriodora subsp. variegata]